MDDVARRAGVSRALVSLVMRESPKVSNARRAAVIAAATELGYRPNVLARNLASHRTQTVGVLIDDLHNQYFAEVMEGIELHGKARGYRVLMNTSFDRDGGDRAALETLLEFRTDGLILLGPRLPDDHILAAAEEVPVVCVGRALPSETVDTVNNDEIAGARAVVQHLVGHGHRDIAHIDGGDGAGAQTRRDGYEQAMGAHGLADFVRVVEGDFTEVSGVEAATEMIRWVRRPTAVFAANDLTAAGALDRFEEEGLRAPADISIVGYDNTALAAMQHMSLSTVDQPRFEMGKLALQSLIERLESSRTSARHEVLEPQLVPRATSGPPASGN